MGLRIPQAEVAGRQIRWASVGRAAAVVAAAIAGIVSLPALLGSDAPPPVPADVGLAQAPLTTQPAPVKARATPPRASRPKPLRPTGNRLAQRRPRHRLAHRRPPHHHLHHAHASHDHASTPSAPAQAPSPAYIPAPAYSPPLPGEFQFER